MKKDNIRLLWIFAVIAAIIVLQSKGLIDLANISPEGKIAGASSVIKEINANKKFNSMLKDKMIERVKEKGSGVGMFSIAGSGNTSVSSNTLNDSFLNVIIKTTSNSIFMQGQETNIDSRLDRYNLVSGKFTVEQLMELSKLQTVQSISYDLEMKTFLFDSISLIKGESKMPYYNNTFGKGVKVCIVDTGIGYNDYIGKLPAGHSVGCIYGTCTTELKTECTKYLLYMYYGGAKCYETTRSEAEICYNSIKNDYPGDKFELTCEKYEPVDPEGTPYEICSVYWVNCITNTPLDGAGHGTHCAGIVMSSQKRVTSGLNGGFEDGVAPDTDLYTAKALSDSGSGSWSNILAGVDWCVNTVNADIVSMSLGGGNWQGSCESDVICQQLSSIIKGKNTIVAVAAGNSGSSGGGAPGCCSDVVSVAAGTKSNPIKPTYFSSVNDEVDITAIGDRVLSTLPNNNFAAMSGTSMATPMVAGSFALLKSLKPDATKEQLTAAVFSSATNLGSPKNQQGNGLINVFKACQKLFACDYKVLFNLQSTFPKSLSELSGISASPNIMCFKLNGATYKAYNAKIWSAGRCSTEGTVLIVSGKYLKPTNPLDKLYMVKLPTGYGLCQEKTSNTTTGTTIQHFMWRFVSSSSACSTSYSTIIKDTCPCDNSIKQ